MSMLTLFAMPKPFRGQIDMIQRNAIRSWTLLRPTCDIILFGNDEGTAEVAQELRVRHVPDVARNEYGTPLLNDLFEKARQCATSPVLGYVNADIILMTDFRHAVEQIVIQKDCFLMIGRRWNLDITEALTFPEDWETKLRAEVQTHGELHRMTGIDYVVFAGDVWGPMPPFAIGRSAWDNWLVYRARSRRVPVIDATQAVTIVHQNHDYAHVAGGEQEAWNGVEAQRNWELAGGERYFFGLPDATLQLSQDGLRGALDPVYLEQRFKRQVVLNASHGRLFRFKQKFLRKMLPYCKYLPASLELAFVDRWLK